MHITRISIERIAINNETNGENNIHCWDQSFRDHAKIFHPKPVIFSFLWCKCLLSFVFNMYWSFHLQPLQINDDKKWVESRKWFMLNLNDDSYNDNKEGISEVEEQPQLHWFDVGSVG